MPFAVNIYCVVQKYISEVFAHLKTVVNVIRQKGKYNIATDIDTTIGISAQGVVEVSDFLNRFTINDLYVKYQGLDIRNATPFSATANRRGIQIDTSIFVRGNEEFIVKGASL